MFISGDGTMLADMGIGLGSLLISSEYSRSHESEADLFAFEKMLILKIDPENFSSIMDKITSDTGFENEIKIRNKVFLSHTYDHRIIDGALGGKFAQKVANYIENFDIQLILG